jgi:hypothetical protein
MRVTWLEPRTPHQPEKLQKLSKNDLVVLLLNFASMKRSRLYVAYFQSSAGRSQAGDRIWCSGVAKFFAVICEVRQIRGVVDFCLRIEDEGFCNWDVNIG